MNITRIIQVAIALPLLIFGANKFLRFIEMGAPPSAEAGAYMMAIFGSYIGISLGILEVIIGLLLVANKYVKLALVLLAPLAYNMVGYHLQYDVAGIVPALVIAVGLLFLFIAHRQAFRRFFLQNESGLY